MSTIPEDLWADILKRLPVRKLIELQRVCESWKALISSSSTFIRDHHHHHTSASRGARLQVNLNLGRDKSTGLCVGQTYAIHHHGTNTITPLHLPKFPRYVPYSSCAGGIVHGVVLVYYCHVEDDNDLLVCLWNPWIRKRVIVPWPCTSTPERVEGLGYDSTNNDFKIVRSCMEGSYDVFSVRDGVWRMNCPLPSRLIGTGSTAPLQDGWCNRCSLNGNIHWIVSPEPEEDDAVLPDEPTHGPFVLLVFECGREEFTTMDLPPGLVRDVMGTPRLFLLDLGDGSLLLSLVEYVAPGGVCELWTMLEYGGSWTKMDCCHPALALAYAAAAAAGDGDGVITADKFKFTLLAPADAHHHHHHARFNVTKPTLNQSYHLQQTMMLMDIGKPC